MQRVYNVYSEEDRSFRDIVAVEGSNEEEIEEELDAYIDTQHNSVFVVRCRDEID